VLFLPVVAAIVLWRAAMPWRARVGRGAAAAGAALLLVAPWSIRSSLAFDRFVLLSNGSGTVLVQANCDAGYYGEKLGYWELRCGLPQPLGPEGEPLNEAERDAALRRRAFDYIEDHAGRLVTVVIPARVGRMWALYDPVQQLRFDVLVEGRNFRLSMVGLAQYYLLLPAAIGGALVVARRRGTLLPLCVWPALTTLTAVTAFGETRYRVASEVAIVTLAAVAAGWVLEARRPAPGPPVHGS
jgi:hypothetical protein